MTLGEEVTLLYAALTGALDAPVEAAGEAGAPALLDALLSRVRESEPDLLLRISKSGLLAESAKERISALVEETLSR
jgi:hypothetical protein